MILKNISEVLWFKVRFLGDFLISSFRLVVLLKSKVGRDLFLIFLSFSEIRRLFKVRVNF